MSSPLAGALMMTFFAPASMWARAFSASVKMPVDSRTMSTPRSPHGSVAGSLTFRTLISRPSMISASSVWSTVPGVGAVRRVVLEEQGVHAGLDEVVDRDHLDAGRPLQDGLEGLSPNAAEAVDPDSNGHGGTSAGGPALNLEPWPRPDQKQNSCPLESTRGHLQLSRTRSAPNRGRIGPHVPWRAGGEWRPGSGGAGVAARGVAARAGGPGPGCAAGPAAPVPRRHGPRGLASAWHSATSGQTNIPGSLGSDQAATRPGSSPGLGEVIPAGAWLGTNPCWSGRGVGRRRGLGVATAHSVGMWQEPGGARADFADIPTPRALGSDQAATRPGSPPGLGEVIPAGAWLGTNRAGADGESGVGEGSALPTAHSVGMWQEPGGAAGGRRGSRHPPAPPWPGRGRATATPCQTNIPG